MTDEVVLGLRALAHPLRLQLLSLVTGAPASAAEASRALGTTHANASYHLRVLERAGLVRVVERVGVRGGQARRYRHEASSRPPAPGDELRTGDSATRQARAEFVAVMAVELQRRVGWLAGGAATFTDAELWVSAGEWGAAVRAVNQVVARLHAVAVAPASPGSTRVSMTVALFPMAPR